MHYTQIHHNIRLSSKVVVNLFTFIYQLSRRSLHYFIVFRHVYPDFCLSAAFQGVPRGLASASSTSSSGSSDIGSNSGGNLVVGLGPTSGIDLLDDDQLISLSVRELNKVKIHPKTQMISVSKSHRTMHTSRKYVHTFTYRLEVSRFLVYFKSKPWAYFKN